MASAVKYTDFAVCLTISSYVFLTSGLLHPVLYTFCIYVHYIGLSIYTCIYHICVQVFTSVFAYTSLDKTLA